MSSDFLLLHCTRRYRHCGPAVGTGGVEQKRVVNWHWGTRRIKPVICKITWIHRSQLGEVIKKMLTKALLVLCLIYFYPSIILVVSSICVCISSLTSLACRVTSQCYFWTHRFFTNTYLILKGHCMRLAVLCLFYCWDYRFKPLWISVLSSWWVSRDRVIVQ